MNEKQKGVLGWKNEEKKIEKEIKKGKNKERRSKFGLVAVLP